MFAAIAQKYEKDCINVCKQVKIPSFVIIDYKNAFIPIQIHFVFLSSMANVN